MKFKVGDKVRLSKKVYKTFDNNVPYTNNMYAGTLRVIEKTNPYSDYIQIETIDKGIKGLFFPSELELIESTIDQFLVYNTKFNCVVGGPFVSKQDAVDYANNYMKTYSENVSILMLVQELVASNKKVY